MIRPPCAIRSLSRLLRYAKGEPSQRPIARRRRACHVFDVKPRQPAFCPYSRGSGCAIVEAGEREGNCVENENFEVKDLKISDEEMNDGKGLKLFFTYQQLILNHQCFLEFELFLC